VIYVLDCMLKSFMRSLISGVAGILKQGMRTYETLTQTQTLNMILIQICQCW